MKIILERDDATFSTLSGPFARYRVFMVKVNGKPFVTSRTVENFSETYDKNFSMSVDEALIDAMERMLTKVFNDACSAIPEGVDLMLKESENHTKNVILDYYR